MTRRSTRSSKRSASPSPQDVPKKRARTKRSPEQSTTQGGTEPRTRRRIAGKLASIMTMPVDVFCEIAFYLSPEDLLSIARASRTLRNLLMSKSSRMIWAAAEQSVGMPPCPPDLSYPQYASLLFDKFCMNCLAHRARRVNIETRARLCKKCEVTEIVSGSGLIPEDMDIMDLAALIPGDKLSYIDEECWFETRQTTYYLLRYQGQRYYEALIISTCREYEASGKDRTWLIERSKRLYQLKLHAYKVNNWLSGRRRDRQCDIESLKQNRRASIYRRLEDLGYSEEDHLTFRDIEYRKCNVMIDQPRELTEKAWAVLRPQLEEAIRLRREKKFRIARQDCVTSRERAIQEFTLSVLKSNEVKLLLSFEELIQLPEVSKIINADGLDKTISESDLQVVKTSAIELGTKRKQESVEMCGAAMTAAFVECGLLPENAMTGDCGEDKPKKHPSISTSNILEHSCALFTFKDSRFDPSRASFNDMVSLYQSMIMRRSLFEVYAPSSQAILIAKRLAEDLDVTNLTLSELDLLGEAFICARCDPIFRKKLNWQHLVQHFLEDKKNFERVKARYRGKLTLETIFANDHCLDDVSTGVSAINISSIDNALDLENFINECKCETCSESEGARYWLGERCGICTKIGAVTTKLCEKGMRVHVQKKHGPLSEDEIMKEIGSSS